ncbi:DUF5677 domain-containing protein [Endozoicomonadaceae bacterium StTr2]
MNDYRSYEEYKSAADILNVVVGMVLLSFAKYNCSKKDVIIRNFVAKGSMSLKGIFSLWDIENYQDGWILYRTLLDRYLHLTSIEKNDQFELFYDWSLFEQVKIQNRIKSDADFKHEAEKVIFNSESDYKEKIKYLSKNKPNWRRPKAEVVAKNLEMDFLYKFGYDMASMHVHPMANDGMQDFFTITGLTSDFEFPTQITVLNNSILITTMLLQDAMNFSSFSWRKILWDFIDQIRSAIVTGSTDYQKSFLKLSNLFPEQPLCQPAA